MSDYNQMIGMLFGHSMASSLFIFREASNEIEQIAQSSIIEFVAQNGQD